MGFTLSTSFLILLVLSLGEASKSGKQNIIITRRKYDKFQLPKALCSKTTRLKCHKFGAKTSRKFKCGCKCTNDKPNFGFFDNKWKCEKSIKIRSYSGCFNPAFESGKMKLLRKDAIITVPKKYGIIWKIDVDYVYNCKLQSSFSYIGCNGTWKQMSHSANFFKCSTPNNINSTVCSEKGERRSYRNTGIAGRVLRLNITCINKLNNNFSYCGIVLKVKGKITCPVTTPSASLSISSSVSHAPGMKMTVTPLASSFSPSHVPSSAQTLSVSSYVSQTLTTTATLYASTWPPRGSTTIHTITKSVTQSSISPNTNHTRNSKKDDVHKSSGAADKTIIIAGTCGGVVALIVVLIIALVITRLFKRSRNTAKNSSLKNVDDTYEQPQDNHLPHTGEQQSTEICNIKNPIYDQCSPVPEDPVYNTLEDPDSVKPEPVYNVLEEPDTFKSTTIEGPTSGSESLYVLEEPESDGNHIYSSLQSEDPHVYGSPNPSNDCNEGNPSASKGKDIYQELNQADRQSCGGEYQPLSYPRISMNMNQLSEDSSQSCA